MAAKETSKETWGWALNWAPMAGRTGAMTALAMTESQAVRDEGPTLESTGTAAD